MTNRTFASAVCAWVLLEIAFLLSLAGPVPVGGLPLT